MYIFNFTNDIIEGSNVTVFCPECGNKCNDDAKFCNVCGTLLYDTAENHSNETVIEPKSVSIQENPISPVIDTSEYTDSTVTTEQINENNLNEDVKPIVPSESPDFIEDVNTMETLSFENTHFIKTEINDTSKPDPTTDSKSESADNTDDIEKTPLKPKKKSKLKFLILAIILLLIGIGAFGGYAYMSSTPEHVIDDAMDALIDGDTDALCRMLIFDDEFTSEESFREFMQNNPDFFELSGVKDYTIYELDLSDKSISPEENSNVEQETQNADGDVQPSVSNEDAIFENIGEDSQIISVENNQEITAIPIESLPLFQDTNTGNEETDNKKTDDTSPSVTSNHEGKTYIVKYTSSSGKEKSISITLVNQAEKRFFFFDSYKIILNDIITENITINTPADTNITFNDKSIDEKYLYTFDNQAVGYKTYKIPKAFSKEHTIKVTGEIYDKYIIETNDKTISIYSDDLKYNDTNYKTFSDKSRDYVEEFVNGVITGKALEDMDIPFSDDKDYYERNINTYQYLKDELSGVCEEIDIKEYDINKGYTRYFFDEDDLFHPLRFDITSTIPLTFDSSESQSFATLIATVDYTYQNGQYVVECFDIFIIL